MIFNNIKIKSGIFSLLFIFLLIAPLQMKGSQSAKKMNKVIKSEIQSNLLNEKFKYFVTLPLGYERSNKKYPVMYILYNGDSVLKHSVSVIEKLYNRSITPQMIVVSIQPNDGRRDLTPTQSSPYGPTSGGAENFLKFINNELFPLIKKTYRTGNQRLFWSHSIGATLGIYSLLKYPKMFTHILVSSPWMIYDLKERYLIKNAVKYFKKRKNVKNYLSIIVGNEPRLKGEIEQFNKIIKTVNPTGLSMDYKYFPGENHQSIKTISLAEGLKNAAAHLKK